MQVLWNVKLTNKPSPKKLPADFWNSSVKHYRWCVYGRISYL